MVRITLEETADNRLGRRRHARVGPAAATYRLRLGLGQSSRPNSLTPCNLPCGTSRCQMAWPVRAYLAVGGPHRPVLLYRDQSSFRIVPMPRFLVNSELPL